MCSPGRSADEPLRGGGRLRAALLSLDGPTETDRYSWTSEALTDGQEHLFVVRIG